MSRSSICTMLMMALISLSVAAQSHNDWTTQDVIDPRVDVHAQYSLMRMFKGDAFERLDASAMLTAVKSGELAGIYIVDQQAPAMRARDIGKSWWTLLPAGIEAICITQPAGKPPLIAFSKRAQKNQHILDPALRSAWASCGLVPAAHRPYTATKSPAQPREKQPCFDSLQGRPTIDVTVLDAITYDPYAGVRVTAGGLDQKCTASLSETTDAEGRTRFELPCTGEYLVEATTGEARHAFQGLQVEGTCQYHVTLAMRPLLDTAEPCDWETYSELLEECDARVEVAFNACTHESSETHPRDLDDPNEKYFTCLEEFRRDKVNCDDTARRGANCK